MLFSATTDENINELANLALETDPVEVDVDSDKISATVSGLKQGGLTDIQYCNLKMEYKQSSFL